MTVPAHRLPTPMVQYGNTTETPNGGAWNLVNKRFSNAAAIGVWAVLCFEPKVPDAGVATFVNGLMQRFATLGAFLSFFFSFMAW